MNNIETLKMALEALTKLNASPHLEDCEGAFADEISALRQAIEQAQKQELVTIWYMRDNHTFKKLSEDVSTALIEIEQEFNEGHTYGMLCSKRKGFPSVHASGDKKRLEFFAECKATLEQWLPKTSPPPRQWVGLTKEDRYQAIRYLYRDDHSAALAGAHSDDEYEAIEAKLKEKNT